MLQAKPLFCGETDIDQLCKVFDILGTIRLTDYAEAANLPDFNNIIFNEIEPKGLQQLWPQVSEEVTDLMGCCLRFNPNLRISSSDAAKHPWFASQDVDADGSGDEINKLIASAAAKLEQARKRRMESFHDNVIKADGDEDDEVNSINSDILNDCDLLDLNP